MESKSCFRHVVASAVVVLLCLTQYSTAISFTLGANTRKCLQEDVDKDVLVVGEYEVSKSPALQINLEITDSRGHPVYRKEDAQKGKFAFTSDDYDVFEICFKSYLDDKHRADSTVDISLNVKIGMEARSYEELAKAEKLQPIEANLKRLEDMSSAIVRSFAIMKDRERQHRDTNELTAERMLTFSLISIGCLVVFGVWQVWYLRRYFQKKKLI
ncbi:transmembrane emp24 domain-containing protein 10 [Salpingoeca rosetta]|uniref:Transmembrane emp24 domain-containing protein 10 n=1 Tax=Salpingoeca rosetta (strain ATCC 50818 / BSB-021) TaxID=946362 RepID=F2UL47_SALR5|nr:transmembrane emp24 domain-containing protein 10 [Salpingoeca rosetta]EGD77846.1 transmembrane emp24 domain-containing protein 10 [Salpingoeca rosetta]|eukprot:XP_004989910.1 transmembrane emp24 domain-containing protein 10 [Salpingoeca rosetta]